MESRHDGDKLSCIDLESRAFACKIPSALSLRILLKGLVVLLFSLTLQSQAPEVVKAVHQSSPNASAALDESSLVLELNRAIDVLKRGLRENWGTRNQYLTTFDKSPNIDSSGRPLTDEKRYVMCEMDGNLRTHRVWDEGLPIESEVRRTIAEFIKLRNEVEHAIKADSRASNPNGQSAEFQLPPCISPAYRTIVLSAGVATAMLKTKIEPSYPAEALKRNISGTVVLQATIGRDGHVTALRTISGPAELRQSARDAVRQWIYRPYLLNGQPVEVETTINVAFVPNR